MHAEDLDKFSRVVKRFAPESTLLRAWDLQGGVSARTVGIEFERPDGKLAMAVVRLHGEIDRAGNPHIAADEHRLLELVQAVGIPVAAPLYLDTTCDIFEIPYLVIAFVEGAPDFEPVDMEATVRTMAEQLATLHGSAWLLEGLAFLPVQEEAVAQRLAVRPERLDETLSEGRVRAALEADWPPQPTNQPTLLHGDYWPGNLLWCDGELAAVIDWEDAATGDPLADLGNTRLELLWSYGPEALIAFTTHYRALMPTLDYANLPCWDLYAALRPAGKLAGWGLDAETEGWMQALHRDFVERALGG